MRGIKLIVALAGSFMALTGSAGAICNVTISTAANNNVVFGANQYTATASPANIDVADLNAKLGAGNVTVTTNGPCVAELGDIAVGTAGTPITWGAGRSLTLSADDDIALTASPLSGTDASSTLVLNASGANGITQDAASPIAVGGTTTLNENSDNAPIDVGNSANDFGPLAMTSHGPIEVLEADDLPLVEISNPPVLANPADPVTLTVGGPITQSGPIHPAAGTVINTTSSVALDNGTNSFAGSVSIPGPATTASLTDSNGGLDLGTTNVTGNLTALAPGGALTQSGAVSSGGQLDAEAQSVTLTNATNDFNLAQLEASAGSVSAVDANAITLTSTTATGSTQVVAGTNLNVTGNPSANALTLVADEASGAATGPGALTVAPGATLTSSGAPVKLYSSRRSQNTIGAGATFNGTPFAAGTEFVNTASEVWGTRFPAGTAANPFTFFYKETPDTTPPETTIDSGPAAGSTTTDSTPAFTFSSSEPGSSFACAVDGGAFAGCTSPHTLATLANGQHTFAVRATDAAGNPDPTPATRTFTVDTNTDKTAPETTLTKTPKRKVKTKKKKAKVVFGFVSNEAGATFECSLDGVAYTPCASPKSYKVKKGDHFFLLRAGDAAGNKDPTPARFNFKVKRKRKRR